MGQTAAQRGTYDRSDWSWMAPGADILGPVVKLWKPPPPKPTTPVILGNPGGLSDPEWTILLDVVDYSPTTAKEIQESLGWSKSVISRSLQVLQEKGLVGKEDHGKSGTSFWYSTEAGRELAKQPHAAVDITKPSVVLPPVKVKEPTEHRKAVSPEKQAEVLRLYAERKPVPEITDLTGVGHKRIYEILHEAGVVRSRGNYTQVQGEKDPHAKLNAATALEIYLTPGSLRNLARRYGVAPTTVGAIKTGKRWADVTGHRAAAD